jgi:hypothetical protein
MRQQKIKSEEEKNKKISFLMNLGYSLEEAHRLRLKVSSCNSYLYWMYKDNLTEEESKRKISELQRKKSPRCVEYWINKGFDLEESKFRVSEIQDNVSHKDGEDIELYKKRCENRKINKDKYIDLYGEENGLQKWLDKKSRSAITLKNMTRVYGKELGLIKWNDYIEKQKISQSEEKLLQKHGDAKALHIINHRKNLNKYCKQKFLITGDHKYLNGGFSKSSQKLFWSIYEFLPEELRSKCYFKELNQEYVLISDNSCFLYDFVITNINICIEFNGDFWHANPKKYKDDDYILEKRAIDIWKNDEFKLNLLKKERNIDTIIVWESEWIKNKSVLENKLTQYILDVYNNHN